MKLEAKIAMLETNRTRSARAAKGGSFAQRPQRRGLHDQAVNEIGREIVAGDLRPGHVLLEADLARVFDMSRSGIREAVKVLAAKGLVASRQKIGTVVTCLDHWNHLDPDVLWWWGHSRNSTEFCLTVMEVRHLIEPGAAALAAERANLDKIAVIRKAYEGMADYNGRLEDAIASDRDFHLAILDATENVILRSFGTLIEAALVASMTLTTRVSPKPIARGLPDHERVLRCIERRNPTAARKAMTRLIDDTRAMLIHAARRAQSRGGQRAS